MESRSSWKSCPQQAASRMGPDQLVGEADCCGQLFPGCHRKATASDKCCDGGRSRQVFFVKTKQPRRPPSRSRPYSALSTRSSPLFTKRSAWSAEASVQSSKSRSSRARTPSRCARAADAKAPSTSTCPRRACSTSSPSGTSLCDSVT